MAAIRCQLFPNLLSTRDMDRRSCAVAVLVALAPGVAAAAQFTLAPESPRVHETVFIRAAPAAGCDVLRSKDIATTMANNRITVVMPITPAGACFPVPPPSQTIHLAIGQLPAGDYEIEVRTELSGVTASLGSRSFTVRPRPSMAPVANYTDLWWNPSESGWGLNVVQHPSDMIFATWFSYDGEGRPEWYVVPHGEWAAVDNNRNFAHHFFTGPIYRTSGPPGGAIDPSRVTRTLVGTAQFAFYEWDRMNATLTIDGQTHEKRLQRQPF